MLGYLLDIVAHWKCLKNNNYKTILAIKVTEMENKISWLRVILAILFFFLLIKKKGAVTVILKMDHNRWKNI